MIPQTEKVLQQNYIGTQFLVKIGTVIDLENIQIII